MVQAVIQELGNTTGTYPCGKKKKWNEVSNNMESKQKRKDGSRYSGIEIETDEGKPYQSEIQAGG